jgi:hypothetical protein
MVTLPTLPSRKQIFKYLNGVKEESLGVRCNLECSTEGDEVSMHLPRVVLF